MRDTAGSAAAPAARCRSRRRGSLILNLPLRSHHSITSSARASRRRRYFKAERPGGLQIDDKLEFDGGLNGKVARLFALQDAIRIGRRAPKIIGPVLSVG